MISYPLIKLTDELGGISQQLPAEYRLVSPGELAQERTDRVSSFDLVSDILKTKKKFTIEYTYLKADVLRNLIALRNSNNNLEMQFQETYAAEVEKYTVRITEPIEVGNRVAAFNGGAYRSVSIEIEEV